MFSRVMLALDLSELTSRMLDVFYSVCLDPGTEVYLLHVVRKSENFAQTTPYYKKTYSRLKGLAQDIRNAGYDNVEIRWVSNQDVLDGIQKSVDQYDINLLIMASHGKGVWAHFIIVDLLTAAFLHMLEFIPELLCILGADLTACLCDDLHHLLGAFRKHQLALLLCNCFFG